MMTLHHFHRAVGKMTQGQMEDRWQKHVIIFLWLIFALFLGLTVAFVLLASHGIIQPNHSDSVPAAWPSGWQ